MKSLSLLCLILICTASFAETNPSIAIDTELKKVMGTYHIPVVGYAIIENNKIISAETLSIDATLKVNKNSLFQAASISKSVSAYGAVKLVSEGKLKLDEDINKKLISWKIPLNQYNKNNPVTLRQLLDMTAGLSVSGFPGYAQNEPLPTLQETLDGQSPANTPPIRAFYTPGSRYFYSGGNFQVVEKLIEDTTQQDFNAWMNKEVLVPLGMTRSLFDCPLPKNLTKLAIPGFLANGKMIENGWNNYPLAAAGGLWTTPTDLAKFAIHIPAEMTVRQKNTDFGLGVVVNGKGKNLNIRKAGHNLGYYSELLIFPRSGDGVVIMTDSENGATAINYMIPVIASKYHWPRYFPFFDELIEIPE